MAGRHWLPMATALACCSVPHEPALALFHQGAGCDAVPEELTFGHEVVQAELLDGWRVKETVDGILVIDEAGAVVGETAAGLVETIDTGGRSIVIGRQARAEMPHLREDPRWVPAGEELVQWSEPAKRWWPITGNEERFLPDVGCAGPRTWSPDGRYYVAFEHVRGQAKSSRPAGVVLCTAKGQNLDSRRLDFAAGSRSSIDHGGRHVAGAKWSPSSNAVLVRQSRVGAPGRVSYPTALAVVGGEWESVAIDFPHVSFTPDGRSLLFPSFTTGCRLVTVPEQSEIQLGPHPDDSMRGIDDVPFHAGCRICMDEGVIRVQDDVDGRVRLYDTIGQFLFSTSSDL
jgi:hypothetical protein